MAGQGSSTTRPPLLPSGPELLPGFRRQRIKTKGAEINVAVAGSGPPLLLIHGNPLTLVSWHKVAPSLAQSFTVVATDICGATATFSKPDGGPDHAGYTFRAMGEDNFEVMQALGFERFAVAGHDRGARVGFRMALDRPESIERFASLDIVPTHHVLDATSRSAGRSESYHWFFMAQKAPYPERLICNDLAITSTTSSTRRASGSRSSRRRRWRSTCAARRPSRSTPSARTTAPPSRSTSPWTAPTSASARSPARCW